MTNHPSAIAVPFFSPSCEKVPAAVGSLKTSLVVKTLSKARNRPVDSSTSFEKSNRQTVAIIRLMIPNFSRARGIF
jgi:hypothetical protein